jgi:fido (protein-threonine AMPylation protein)
VVACPEWFKPESVDQLPYVVAGLADFYRFIISACKRHYVIEHGDIKVYHKRVFEKVVPLEYYAGNYRCKDASKPCLAQEVGVNQVPGVSFAQVPTCMSAFSAEFHDWITRTDEYLNHSVSPTERAQAVAQLAAAAMGRLINIHPFLNGNGRISRMLVNYVFRRYGYRMPFRQAQIRPPEAEYSVASAAAMGPAYSSSRLYIYILGLIARAVGSP